MNAVSQGAISDMDRYGDERFFEDDYDPYYDDPSYDHTEEDFE